MKHQPAIGVAVVGTGYFGSGLLRRLTILDGFVPRVAANRTLAHALSAFERAGVDTREIVLTDDLFTAQRALDAGCHVATTDLLMPAGLRGIDVVAEATG